MRKELLVVIMNKIEFRQLGEAVLDRMKNIEFDKSFADVYNPKFAGVGRFQWSSGVGLYGAWKLYEHTNDEKIIEYLCGWFDGHIKKGLPGKDINTMCPFLTLAFLYEKTGIKEYAALCREWALWLYEELPRTDEGGFVHKTGAANDGQLWMDTLFVAVLFLAKAGIMFDKEEYIKEAQRQFLVHTKYLADTSTGLFFHGYSFIGKHNFSRAVWGRGNGWYAIAAPELLEIAKGHLEPVAKGFIEESFKTQMKSLLNYQDKESGMWRTLVNDETSYLESTATTAFAYGMIKGIKLEVLPEDYRQYAEKALKAIISRTQNDGTVLDASGGTPIFETLEEYKNVVKVPIVYEQGMAMMLYAECGKIDK